MTDMTERVQEMVARLRTDPRYLTPAQIAADELGADTVIVLGQGDYPTLRQIADGDRAKQEQAADLLEVRK